jgi:hypothetical protein
VKPPRIENTVTAAQKLRLMGMNISLVAIVEPGGKRFLTVKVDDAGAVVHFMVSPTENSIISIQAQRFQGVGVLSQEGASICVGPVENAIQKDMGDILDG